jgi:hypothetical protein
MVNEGTDTKIRRRGSDHCFYLSILLLLLCTHLGSEEGADTAKEGAAANTHRPNHGREQLAAVDENGAEAGDDGRLAHQGQAGHQTGRIPAAGGRRCRCRWRPDKGLDADDGDADGTAEQEVGDERAAAAETA